MVHTPDTTHRFIKIREQCIENRICQNRTVCSNLYIPYTSDISKNLKNYERLENLHINQQKKESTQKLFHNKNEN